MSKTGWQIVAIMLGGVLTILPAHADTFGSGSNSFTIEFVDIGNAGNADDRALDNTNDTPGDPNDDEYASPYGGVSYVYRMGATEVPQDWITQATNLGLTNVTGGAWSGLQPAANMSWFEAAAFVNWLNTSTGHQAAYQLSTQGPIPTMRLWSSAEAWQLGGQNLYRHKDTYYFLPSEDEWYKAAYHKNDGPSANYWDYGTGSNSIPIAVASGTEAGTAVYDQPHGGTAPAAVDNNGGLSAYGTRGQHGNVEEWIESAFDGLNNDALENRTFRDGLWGLPELEVRSSFRNVRPPLNSDNPAVGFRVASVPEPSSALLMIGPGLMLLSQERRRLRKQLHDRPASHS